jgi:hypothetical protein
MFPKQSFTKLVDTTIRKLPGKGEGALASGSGSGNRTGKPRGVLRTTEISTVDSQQIGEAVVDGTEFEMQRIH